MADTEAPGSPGELRPTGRPNARLRQTVTDMVRSLALVLGVVAVVLLITLRPQPDPVRVIDPAPALAAARAAAPYPVLYPAGLSDGWRPTSARWQATEESAPEPSWHVGFVTPGDAYAQLGQSVTQNPAYVREQTLGGQPVGMKSIGATGDWQQYDNGDGTRSLMRVDAGVTIIVSGTADWGTLEDLAVRLSPQAVP